MKALRASVIVAVAMLFALPSFAEEEPFGEVGPLLATRRYIEARTALVRVRDAAIAKGDVRTEANAWLLLALADSGLSDATSARANLEQAVKRFAESGDLFAGWLAAWAGAELEKAQGQYVTSIAHSERALQLLAQLAEPEAPFTLDSFVTLGVAFGVPAAQAGPMKDHPQILKPFLLQFADVVTRITYADALVEAGELERAETNIERAKAGAALFGGLFQSTIASVYGDLRRRQWRLDEARDHYKIALSGVKSIPTFALSSVQLEIRILGKLARLEWASGRADEGLRWNARALEIARASGDADLHTSVAQARAGLLHDDGQTTAATAAYADALKIATTTFRKGSIHAELGTLYFFDGQYGKALEHLEKAIALFQKSKSPQHEAIVWGSLAEVHLMLGGPELAGHAIENAERLVKESDFTVARDLVRMLKTAKNVYSGKGLPDDIGQAFLALWDTPELKDVMFRDDAMQYVLASFNLDRPTKDGPLPADIPAAGLPFLKVTALTVRGKVLMDSGRHEEARKHWRQALTLDPNRDHVAGLHGLIGTSYWLEGNGAEAVRHFEQAAATIEASAADVKVEELMSSYLGSNRRWYHEFLIELLIRQGRLAEAFSHTERARGRTFLQMLGNHRLNPGQNADTTLREAEVLRAEIETRERQMRTIPAADARQIEVDLVGARQRYQTLTVRAKTANPEYASITNVEPLPLDAVRAEVAEDTTLISYFRSAKFAHAWVIDRANMHYAQLSLDEESLRRIVCWADDLGPRTDARGVDAGSRTCEDAATAEEAFEKLMAPLLKNIAHRKLVIVPHGVLHYVPFAALRNPKTGRYLVEDYTITYAPSASALRFLREKESPVEGRALVLGDPASPLPSLRKLPGAKREASTVAEKLGTTAQNGSAACESLLYELDGKVDLVHLAAHGIYDPLNPIFSRIALADDAQSDGSLTVHEILSKLDLRGVNLVVLSACSTAVGARSGGDEIVGLTRALLYAGTPGVLSTLWNIDDTASAALMNEFYERLVAGAPAAEALRDAQRTAIEHGGDPRYWAAFTLHGDPQGRWMPEAR